MFKYHPDNVIYRNGSFDSTYDDFKNANPAFPIILGQFFEYKNGKLDFINNEGHHIEANIEEHQVLIDAINNL